MKGVSSPGGNAMSSATRIAVGSVEDGKAEPSVRLRVGATINNLVGSIESKEKDLDSLPDCTVMSL
jgi:hypothetical protein